jgi:hypothetical protein
MTEASYDYRVLQASHITDPNGNLAEFRFSPAGLLAAQYLRGKNGEGDVANPIVRMEYDLLAFVNRGQRPRDGSQATAFRQTMSTKAD